MISNAFTVLPDPLLALPAVLEDDLESVRVLVEAGLPSYAATERGAA